MFKNHLDKKINGQVEALKNSNKKRLKLAQMAMRMSGKDFSLLIRTGAFHTTLLRALKPCVQIELLEGFSFIQLLLCF